METSLLNWVNSFEVIESSVAELKNLSDGVIFYQILREIAPDSFHEGGVKQNVGSNAILKANNIKKIMKDLDAYYRGVFLQSFDVDAVNPTAVAAGESAEVMKLAELVLGCAVQCDDKHRYIQKLMSLDKTDQANLMVLTQRILSRGEASALDRSEGSILEADDDGERAVIGGEEEDGASPELASLQERVVQLEAANQDLHQRLSASNDQAAELSNDLTNALSEKARYQTLYNEAVEGGGGGGERGEGGGAKEKVQELEMRAQDQEATITQLQEKLSAKHSDLVRLQDDVQIKNSEVESLTAEVSKLRGYKEKLEQAGDLKRLLADKESESEKLLEQVVDLEQAVEAYKQQLDDKDRQTEGLRTKLAQAQKRRPSTEGGGGGEGEEAQEQLEELDKRHQDTLIELQAVRAELDKVKAERDTALGGSGEEGVADYAVSSLTLDDKKKMLELKTQVARMTKENAELKARGGGGGGGGSAGGGDEEAVQGLREALMQVKSELAVSAASNAKLEGDRSALQGEVAELRAKMGVSAGASGELGEEVQRLRKSNAELQTATEKMREDLTRHVEERGALLSEKERLAQTNMEMERTVFEAEKKVWEADHKAKTMEEKLAGGGVSKEQADDLLLAENRQLKSDLTEKRKLIARKDEELGELTRMKNELQIAAADSTQATVLQQQIRDMQRREEEKEKASKRRLAAQEREQKLVVSLMYDLGMELHRTKMYQRANLEKPPLLSWLERKRREMNSDSSAP